PVVYTDFLSMYPTVNSLMGLWRLVTAGSIRVVKPSRREIVDFLERITRARLFEPETWAHLPAFVRVIPDGGVLPIRAPAGHAQDWAVAINHVYADPKRSQDALWYALPDVVASVLLTGRVPKIVDAFQLAPEGLADTLQPTSLYGAVPVDPRSDDFFRRV